jgi:hypothetical protein
MHASDDGSGDDCPAELSTGPQLERLLTESQRIASLNLAGNMLGDTGQETSWVQMHRWVQLHRGVAEMLHMA